MRYFCTYFDSNYLDRGLALYNSLARHAGPFRLWVLCFDDVAYQALYVLALPGLEPIKLSDFEAGDDALLAAKANRSRMEYYFTSTPSLVRYVLTACPEAGTVTYLDADLFFYADPAPIEAEWSNGSVLIIAHRFPAGLRRLEDKGIYNVGYLSFRRDGPGLACLEWWRARCLEWCYDRVEGDRYADQKYLDRFPTLFPGVVSLANVGAGLAPWNAANYTLSTADRDVLVDGAPLIFYHFHGLRRVAGALYDPQLGKYGAPAGQALKRDVYGPYLAELERVKRFAVARLGPGAGRAGSIRSRRPEAPSGRNAVHTVLRRVKHEISLAGQDVRRVIRGEVWLVIGGRLL